MPGPHFRDYLPLYTKAKLMKEEELLGSRQKKRDRLPHRVRLPGFISDEEVGLGDAIKRVTYAMGVKPCAGCEKRAAALNRWIIFSR
jgi:hypothetical protein